MGGIFIKPGRLHNNGIWVMYSEELYEAYGQTAKTDAPFNGPYVVGRIVHASRHAEDDEWIYTLEKSKNLVISCRERHIRVLRDARIGMGNILMQWEEEQRLLEGHEKKGMMGGMGRMMRGSPKSKKKADIPNPCANLLSSKSRSVGVICPEMARWVFLAEILERVEIVPEIKLVHQEYKSAKDRNLMETPMNSSTPGGGSSPGSMFSPSSNPKRMSLSTPTAKAGPGASKAVGKDLSLLRTAAATKQQEIARIAAGATPLNKIKITTKDPGGLDRVDRPPSRERHKRPTPKARAPVKKTGFFARFFKGKNIGYNYKIAPASPGAKKKPGEIDINPETHGLPLNMERDCGPESPLAFHVRKPGKNLADPFGGLFGVDPLTGKPFKDSEPLRQSKRDSVGSKSSEGLPSIREDSAPKYNPPTPLEKPSSPLDRAPTGGLMDLDPFDVGDVVLPVRREDSKGSNSVAGSSDRAGKSSKGSNTGPKGSPMPGSESPKACGSPVMASKSSLSPGHAKATTDVDPTGGGGKSPSSPTRKPKNLADLDAPGIMSSPSIQEAPPKGSPGSVNKTPTSAMKSPKKGSSPSSKNESRTADSPKGARSQKSNVNFAFDAIQFQQEEPRPNSAGSTESQKKAKGLKRLASGASFAVTVACPTDVQIPFDAKYENSSEEEKEDKDVAQEQDRDVSKSTNMVRRFSKRSSLSKTTPSITGSKSKSGEPKKIARQKSITIPGGRVERPPFPYKPKRPAPLKIPDGEPSVKRGRRGSIGLPDIRKFSPKKSVRHFQYIVQFTADREKMMVDKSQIVPFEYKLQREEFSLDMLRDEDEDRPASPTSDGGTDGLSGTDGISGNDGLSNADISDAGTGSATPTTSKDKSSKEKTDRGKKKKKKKKRMLSMIKSGGGAMGTMLKGSKRKKGPKLFYLHTYSPYSVPKDILEHLEEKNAEENDKKKAISYPMQTRLKDRLQDLMVSRRCQDKFMPLRGPFNPDIADTEGQFGNPNPTVSIDAEFLEQKAPKLGKTIFATELALVYGRPHFRRIRSVDVVDAYREPLYCYFSLPTYAGMISFGRNHDTGECEFLRKKDTGLLGLVFYVNGELYHPSHKPLPDADNQNCQFIPGAVATFTIDSSFTECVFTFAPEEKDMEVADDIGIIEAYHAILAKAGERRNFYSSGVMAGQEPSKAIGRRHSIMSPMHKITTLEAAAETVESSLNFGRQWKELIAQNNKFDPTKNKDKQIDVTKIPSHLSIDEIADDDDDDDGEGTEKNGDGIEKKHLDTKQKSLDERVNRSVFLIPGQIEESNNQPRNMGTRSPKGKRTSIDFSRFEVNEKARIENKPPAFIELEVNFVIAKPSMMCVRQVASAVIKLGLDSNVKYSINRWNDIWHRKKGSKEALYPKRLLARKNYNDRERVEHEHIARSFTTVQEAREKYLHERELSKERHMIEQEHKSHKKSIEASNSPGHKSEKKDKKSKKDKKDRKSESPDSRKSESPDQKSKKG